MGSNLLSVDDDEVTRMIIRMVLEQVDPAVGLMEAVHGEHAIRLMEAFDNQGPDLILLDLNMPMMDGWGFLHWFSERQRDFYPETRVVILTSSNDPRDHERSKRFSCVTGSFQKPVTPDLVRKILSLLPEKAD